MKRNRIVSLLIGMLCIVLLSGCGADTVQDESVVPVGYDEMMGTWKQQVVEDTVTCWYTSDTDKAWLTQMSEMFQQEYGIGVQLVYYDGVSLFDDMNRANQSGMGPGVYLIGNDQLELARNSGMLAENTAFDDTFWDANYPLTAKRALTYGDKQYGYPVYFDTYCLVYDANLLENAPASIDDILAFLDEYEDTGSTKAIFRWDVADPYINTMFIASYAQLFGENGDDVSRFKVNDAKSIEAMEYFQSLSAYLWMDKSNISHDTVMRRIQDGTLVLGLCKSDILPALYEMQENAVTTEPDTEDASEDEESGQGEDQTESSEEAGQEEDRTDYQISYVPSLTAELSSTTLSTTYGAFVNPYAADEAAANMFALYLSYAHPELMYDGNGKLPVIEKKDSFDDMQSVLYAQYLNSKPVPKVLVLGDYLSESSIAFDAIWSGKEVKAQLDSLQDIMEQKINE